MKITTTNELKISNLFIDGDTRIITLKNPKPTITREEIINLENLIKNGTGTESLLIGDKYQSDFRRIQEVTKTTKETIEYDINAA